MPERRVGRVEVQPDQLVIELIADTGGTKPKRTQKHRFCRNMTS